MKILFVNNFFGAEGGAEKLIFDEAQLLKKNSFEVFFFATNRKPYLTQTGYTEYFPEYVNYRAIKGARRVKYLFKRLYNLEASGKIESLIKDIKPDLVHFHNIYHHLSFSVVNACAKHKIPLVMTIHDIRFICPGDGTFLRRTGSGEEVCPDTPCISGNPVNCITHKCKAEGFIANLTAAVEHLFTREARIYDKISYFICPSRAIMELAGLYGIKKHKLVHIPNFLQDSYFKIKPEKTNKGYFLYVGRLNREKGVNSIIRAMKLLPPEVKLHIVGTGEEEGCLKKTAEDENLGNIEFLGYKTGEELEEQYKYCIATLLPTYGFESFGLTIIESFAYAKPVIGSNAGSIPELITHNLNGLIFNAGDHRALASCMLKLYNNPALTQEMGMNGHQKLPEYNAQEHFSKLSGLYGEICN